MANDILFYDHHYAYETCKQQGIIFNLETIAPIRTLEAEPSGFNVYNFRVHNHVLGEGTVWGVGRVTAANSTTRTFETCLLYTFL